VFTVELACIAPCSLFKQHFSPWLIIKDCLYWSDGPALSTAGRPLLHVSVITSRCRQQPQQQPQLIKPIINQLNTSSLKSCSVLSAACHSTTLSSLMTAHVYHWLNHCCISFAWLVVGGGRSTEGFSCADLLQLCHEAALQPVREVRWLGGLHWHHELGQFLANHIWSKDDSEV
jgi:hypothetical protein